MLAKATSGERITVWVLGKAFLARQNPDGHRLNSWRSSSPDYLRDNNISSVGIGYKRKEGKPTDQLSIQFT
ncbi:MAG: hypothetical protein ACRED0_05725, partial [Gammaproteobacteria bacterium]